MKNASDSENYNREFKDLQMQIYDMASLKFNGVSMFATTTAKTGGAQEVFDNLNQSKGQYGQCLRQCGWKCRGYRQRKQVSSSVRFDH